MTDPQATQEATKVAESQAEVYSDLTLESESPSFSVYRSHKFGYCVIRFETDAFSSLEKNEQVSVDLESILTSDGNPTHIILDLRGIGSRGRIHIFKYFYTLYFKRLLGRIPHRLSILAPPYGPERAFIDQIVRNVRLKISVDYNLTKYRRSIYAEI